MLLALTLAGCAMREPYPSDMAPEYMTSRSTDFFEYGPMQPGLPEKLEQQTFFTVLDKSSGYSRVQLTNGKTGYVASEDIEPAPPTARAVPADRPSRLRGDAFPDAPATPLPEPDLELPVDDVPAQ